jgi:hypothetical protein
MVVMIRESVIFSEQGGQPKGASVYEEYASEFPYKYKYKYKLELSKEQAKVLIPWVLAAHW